MSLSFEEREWLEDLFDTYYDKVYAFLCARTFNKALAEDLTSQTFLKVAEKLNTYNCNKGALSTWLFTIAMNEMRSYYRIQKGKESINLDDILELPSDTDVEKSFCVTENRKFMTALLNELDERQHSIITLKYYGNLSNKEISGILKVSETNVSTMLNRIIKKLKNILVLRDEFPDYAYKGQEEKL